MFEVTKSHELAATIVHLDMFVAVQTQSSFNSYESDGLFVDYEKKHFVGHMMFSDESLHSVNSNPYASWELAEHMVELLVKSIVEGEHPTEDEVRWMKFAAKHARQAFEQLGLDMDEAALAGERLYELIDKTYDKSTPGWHIGGTVTVDPADYFSQQKYMAQQVKLNPSTESMQIPELSRAVPALQSMVQLPRELRDQHVDDKLTLSRAIQLLNDQHQWTREQIADWLESLDLDLEIKDMT